MADKKQQLVLSILDFLAESMQDGTIKDEDKEGLEVAAQSIGEAFGVDPADPQQRERLSVKPADLQTIFDIFLKTRDKVATAASLPPPNPQQSVDKSQAEKLKQNGNSQMSRKEYAQAIQSYTEAITLDPSNPVYYSNRAAAHSSLGDHRKAVDDAEKAIEIDPHFVKAFSRLGHAHYSLGDFESAVSAFQRGLEVEPHNANLKSGLEQAQTRVPSTSPPSADTSQNAPGSGPGAGGLPDLGNMAEMLRGIGGGGGGMPDLSTLLNNPAIMSMAQNMMANGGLERMMQNPAVASMMGRMQSGEGMPSVQDIVNDPNLRELASEFGGGTRTRGGQTP